MTTSSTAEAPTVTNKNLSNRQVVYYAVGDISSNIFFQMTALFLVVYMTEIAGISAAAAGAIYGITKIMAGVFDLIVGQTVDRTRTRWGKLRPYLLFGSFPLALTFVLMFSVPSGLSMTATIAWLFLFDAAFQLAYSFVNIPYGSLSAAITEDPVDRSKLSGARSITNAFAGVALSFFVAPQFEDTQADNIRLQFTLVCLGLGILAVLLLIVTFAKTKEVVPQSEERASLVDAFKGLGKNRPLLVLCAGAFFVLGALFTMNAVAMYYTSFIIGNPSWFVWMQLSQTVAMVLIASFVPAITVRLGKRNGYIACAVIGTLGYLVIFFVPSGSLLTAVLGWFLVGVGMGGTNALMFSMQADTVDYGEYATGIRAEGGSYSILSFIRKVGQGVGGWLGGAVIAGFGYIPQQDVQSDSAIFGIRLATGLIPAVLLAAAIIVILFYKLDSQKHAQIVSELRTRRTQQFVASSKDVPVEQVVTGDVGDGRQTLMRKSTDALPPIVTLFGQRGSGATDIAPLLAKELGVPYIKQAFDYRALAEVDPRNLIDDTAFDRWLRVQATSGGVTGDLLSTPGGNSKVASEIQREVLTEAQNGGVVLGRNGTVILGDVVGTLHVRLVAPLEKRLERVMHQTGLSREEALEQCDAEDRLRAEMSRNLFHWDPRQEKHYDLVVNTGTVTYEQVVEFISKIYYSKYPQATRPAGAGVRDPEVLETTIVDTADRGDSDKK